MKMELLEMSEEEEEVRNLASLRPFLWPFVIG